MTDPDFETRIRVRYAETDQMRFVYYANHLVYWEVARTEWLEANGISYREMEANGFAVPVLEAHCSYLSPARYGDELAIRTTPSLVDGLRIRFDYRTRRLSDRGEILCTGWTLHVCMDAAGRPRRPPRELSSLLRNAAPAA